LPWDKYIDGSQPCDFHFVPHDFHLTPNEDLRLTHKSKSAAAELQRKAEKAQIKRQAFWSLMNEMDGAQFPVVATHYTAANESDVAHTHEVLHGQEDHVFLIRVTPGCTSATR
jgi:hypothetical protein